VIMTKRAHTHARARTHTHTHARTRTHTPHYIHIELTIRDGFRVVPRETGSVTSKRERDGFRDFQEREKRVP
jgi:hypothetical protein